MGVGDGKVGPLPSHMYNMNFIFILKGLNLTWFLGCPSTIKGWDAYSFFFLQFYIIILSTLHVGVIMRRWGDKVLKLLYYDVSKSDKLNACKWFINTILAMFKINVILFKAHYFIDCNRMSFLLLSPYIFQNGNMHLQVFFKTYLFIYSLPSIPYGCQDLI